MRSVNLPSNSPQLSWNIYFGNINHDGQTDFIIPQIKNDPTEQTVLWIFTSTTTGYASQIVTIPKETYTNEGNLTRAILISDFNSDKLTDFIIYDSGTYSFTDGIGGHGVTPYLFLGTKEGSFQRTNTLESVYGTTIGSDSRAIDSTVAVKNVDIADIDLDGDIDLWVESNGATNIAGHFLINNGNGFAVDKNNRVPENVYWNFEANFSNPNRFYLGKFLKFNADEYSDLLLGQLKHLKDSATSVLLINDGKGSFKSNYSLPGPNFNQGYTRVLDALSEDLNNDGIKELIVLHTRYDMSQRFPSWSEPGSNGFYIQILSFKDGKFLDTTDTFIKDQNVWSNFKNPQYAQSLIINDVNNDGRKDILLNYGGTWNLNKSLPKVLLNSSSHLLLPVSVQTCFPQFDGRSEPLFQVIDNNAVIDIVRNNVVAQNATQIQIDYDFFLTGQDTGSPSTTKQITGTERDDRLIGSTADDILIGLKGDDTIMGGIGSDTIEGGLGIDTAVYEGLRENFLIKATVSGRYEISYTGPIIAVYPPPATEGTDTLISVERIQFADTKIALDTDGVAGRGYRIYKAAFDRIPDTGGLGYWIAQMDKGMDVVEVAARFIDSSEFRSLYGQNPSNAEFLTKVYSNVLDRTPDDAGLAWWVNEMKTNPAKSWQKVLADFSESTENQANVASLIANGISYHLWT